MKRRAVRIFNTDENPIEMDPNTGLPIQDKPTLDSYGARWVDVEPEERLTDRQKFDREEARLEKEKWNRTVGPALAENLRLRQEMKAKWDVKLKAFYSHRPVQELLSAQNILSDASIVLPLRGGTPRNNAAEIDASNEWANSLEDRGYTLSNSGKTRVALFAAACSECDCDMNLKSSWDVCMERLRELDVFGDELTLNENYRAPRAPEPVVEPEPELDLESIPDTREGRQQAMQILEGHYFGKEASAVWARWTAHLLQHYQFSPTEKQARAAVEWFSTSNQSFLNEAAYDKCRRAMVYRGIFPDHMLTRDEQLAKALEENDVNDFGSKRDFVLASRRING